MLESSPPPLLPPQLIAILRDLIEEHVGIEYRDADLRIFSEKVTARSKEAGFASVLDYYYFLRYDSGSAAELGALVDAIVVGETYFFRELEALRASIHEVVAPIVARHGRARVWCAGCASGEEPLSIAMLLAEANLTDRCELVATDVSARALARAREGFYSGQSLRRLPPAPAPEGWTESLASVVRTSMKRHDDDDAATAATAATAAISIAPALLSKMDYRNVNLLDAAAVKNLGKFDLVLCRNVLIYFSETAVRKVVSSLADALTTTDEYEAGCASSILIGTSESLLFNTVVRCVTRGGMAFYVNGARLPHTR